MLGLLHSVPQSISRVRTCLACLSDSSAVVCFPFCFLFDSLPFGKQAKPLHSVTYGAARWKMEEET